MTYKTVGNDKVQWERGGKPHVLRTYERLHANKLGAHWIWMAMERIAAGESELDVLLDYGYAPEVPNGEAQARVEAGEARCSESPGA